MKVIHLPKHQWLLMPVVLLVAVLHLLPLYLTCLVALKSPQEMASIWSVPKEISLTNFSEVWQAAHLGRAFLNNFVITLGTILCVLFLGAMAAYPLARYPTRGNNGIYLLSVSCLIVPPLTILVPLYKQIVGWGGINTYWAMIAIQSTFTLPLAIFIYAGFIRTIPRELDDAAVMDGYSRFAVFCKIVLPLLKPVTAMLVILIGVQVWNDFQFSLFFLQRREMQTVPVVLSQFFLSIKTM